MDKYKVVTLYDVLRFLTLSRSELAGRAQAASCTRFGSCSDEHIDLGTPFVEPPTS